MKSISHQTDQALVLRKTVVKDNHQRVTFFTRSHGLLVLTSFGSKKITSKRLSHLETGNVVQLAWRVEGDFAIVNETELLFAHSKIKEDPRKLDAMYKVLFILMRLLPEGVAEEDVYARVLAFLKDIYAHDVTTHMVRSFITDVLLTLGFVDESTTQQASFDPVEHVEGLIGRKVGV